MNFEIHMFLAIAKSASTYYPADERHALHIYLRQPLKTEHNWAAAEAIAIKNGWAQIAFKKAGTLPPESKERTDAPFRSCYEAAVRDGDSILVYSDPIRSDATT